MLWILLILSTRHNLQGTRTPVFWGYSPPPNDYPYSWVILDPKSKEDTVKVTNLKKLPKFQFMLHATHLHTLLDKMCKYEMDPMSIIEDTERTWFCLQMDRRTDGQGETSVPPFNLVAAGDIKINQQSENSIWHKITNISSTLTIRCPCFRGWDYTEVSNLTS